MTAPITPDERAAMRERAERLHHYGGESQEASEDILTALDALDIAEAKVDLLKAEIRRDLARLNGPERSTPTPHAPVWDEDTVTEAGAQTLWEHTPHLDETAVFTGECDCGWRMTNPGPFPTQDEHHRHVAAAVLAVVREHLPVRPNRETTERALLSASGDWDMSPLDRSRMVAAQTHSVLDLWPGESRATVQAEALHDAADAEESLHSDYAAAERLRARADRLKQGEK